MQGGRYVTCKQTWSFAPYIKSLVPVIGHSRAGICRRPILSNDVRKQIAGICEKANLQGRCAMTFGRHIKAFIPRSNLCTWRPTAIHSIHRLCEQSMRYMCSVKSYEPATRNAGSDDEVEETRASSVTHMDTGEQCYFGHRTTTTRVRGKSVWNRNPACSWWPGRVPGLVTLCNKWF